MAVGQVTEDRPFKKEAEALGLDPRYLRDLNASRLKGLQLSAWLKKDTWLQVRRRGNGPAFTDRLTFRRSALHALNHAGKASR